MSKKHLSIFNNLEMKQVKSQISSPSLNPKQQYEMKKIIDISTPQDQSIPIDQSIVISQDATLNKLYAEERNSNRFLKSSSKNSETQVINKYLMLQDYFKKGNLIQYQSMNKGRRNNQIVTIFNQEQFYKSDHVDLLLMMSFNLIRIQRVNNLLYKSLQFKKEQIQEILVNKNLIFQFQNYKRHFWKQQIIIIFVYIVTITIQIVSQYFIFNYRSGNQDLESSKLSLTFSRLCTFVILMYQAQPEYDQINAIIFRSEFLKKQKGNLYTFLNAIFGFCQFLITAMIQLVSCWILIDTHTHLDIWLSFTALFYISKIDNEYIFKFRVASNLAKYFHPEEYLDNHNEIIAEISSFYQENYFYQSQYSENQLINYLLIKIQQLFYILITPIFVLLSTYDMFKQQSQDEMFSKEKNIFFRGLFLVIASLQDIIKTCLYYDLQGYTIYPRKTQ